MKHQSVALCDYGTGDSNGLFARLFNVLILWDLPKEKNK